MAAVGAPCVGVQDMYGSFLPLLRRLDACGEMVRLRRLCVSDPFAQDQIISALPAARSCLAVTGGPHFDKVMTLKDQWPSKRQALQAALGIDKRDVVFLVVGGLNGTAEMLQLLEEASSVIGGRIRAIVRMHPRATPDETQQVTKFRRVSLWFRRSEIEVDPMLVGSSEELLPAADFILSGYTTTNHFAILLGMVGVIYAGTSSIRRDHKAEKGLDRPPEVVAGAAWYVQTSAELVGVVRLVLQAPETGKVTRLIKAQAQLAACNDGKAAERVWQEVKKLL